MFKATMPKATTAIVSLLFVACVCVLIHPAPAPLAAMGIVSALLLTLVVTIAGMGSLRGTRRGSKLLWRFLRDAAPGLLVLLIPALVWAGGFSTAFLGVVTTLSTPGITLNAPAGVAVDTFGNVYISDGLNNGQVVEVTATGVALALAFPGLSPALNNPREVAVDESGNLYVADGANARVVELSAGGVASVVNTGSLLAQPFGLALDAAGDLYISDSLLNYIVEVPAGGGAAVQFVISGLGTPLSTPEGLAVDVSGNLYIADNNNNRIVKVTPVGVGSVLGISGLGTPLSHPQDVAVDGLGNFYIADFSNNRIVTVTPAGVGNVLSTGSDTVSAPESVAVSVGGAIYIADAGNNRIVEPQPTTVGFGHLPTGAVSGTTLTLPFTIAQGTTLGSVQALIQGTAGLDFTVVSAGTTCISGITNTACNLNVQFLPTDPGLRRGEVVLFNNASKHAPIISVPLYATGDAPLAALSPGTASLVSTAPLTTAEPFQVAFDGAGNTYVANYGSVAGNVIKVPAGGGSATVVSTGGLTLAGAIGVVLDGAGNLYISDHDNNRILEVTAGGVVSTLNITGLSPGLDLPTAIAMDAAGNLYISDYGRGRIVKVTPSGAGSVLGTGSFTFASVSVLGVAVDAAGTVYIPDSLGNRVVKVSAAGAASLVVPTGITPLLDSPRGVAVDALGNLYIADAGNSRIVEVTTAGVASVVQMPGQSLVSDYGVTVDTSGNVFIPDFGANHIVKVNVAGASLAFPNTNVGSTSDPQTATVTNLGDLPLVFADSPVYTPDFSQPTGASDQCLIATSLAPGTVCDVSVQFTPQSAALLSESILLTNNNLNATNATQSVAVSGTGISVANTTAVAVSTNPNGVILGQPTTITAIVTDTTTGRTAIIPTGGVTFMDTVGASVVSLNGGSAVALNGTGMAILAGATLSGAGLHTITANYVGVSGAFLASGNTTTLQVAAGPTTPIISWTPPSGAMTYGATLSGVLNASAASGSTTVAGTFTYSATPLGGTASAVTGATVLGAGSYTIATTFTPTNTTAYTSASASVALTVAKATPAVALISSANPVPLATSVTFKATVSSTASTPSGSVSFYDGTTLLGSGTLVQGVATYTTSNLPAGALSITAAYGGDSNFSTLTSSALTETVTAATTIATSTTLTASPNPLADGQPATLTATVSPAPTGSPAGTVSFYNGTTLLGTGTLNASGVATSTTSSLVAGADSLTAVYPGNAGYAASTSSAVSETITTAYTVTAPATPVQVAPGGSVTVNITVPPLGGTFDSVVTLSASGLPPGATATFNPATVTPGSAGASTVMTIQLATLAASIPVNHIPSNQRGLPVGPFCLGFVLFGAVLGRKRIPKALVLVLLLAGLGVTTSLLTGCSGGFANTPSTPVGNYTVTVKGTSGSFQASTTLTLVVE